MTRALPLVAAVVLAGCAADVRMAAPLEMPWGQRVTMQCMDGKSMVVDFIPEPRSARVFVDEKTVFVLRQVDAASDAKFTDGRVTLYIERPVAALVVGDQMIRRACQP